MAENGCAVICKVVVLDFDGVVLESADIKTTAFRALFAEFPDHLEAIVNYHLQNAGISRYKKFAYVYAGILRRPLDEQSLLALGRRFSEIALEEIKKAPFVPGALEFLQEYSRRLKLYVASGTPEEELAEIVKARGLEPYFVRIYGTPAAKADILRRVLKEQNVESGEVLFVGDSTSDYEAARKVSVLFVGRVPRGVKGGPFAGFDVNTVSDLRELSGFLNIGRVERAKGAYECR